MTDLLDHVLGCSPNTTLSLYESLPLNARHDSEGWLMLVHLVDDQDGIDQVSDLIGHIDHVLPLLLVITVLLYYLIHPQTKLVSCSIMCIIVT